MKGIRFPRMFPAFFRVGLRSVRTFGWLGHRQVREARTIDLNQKTMLPFGGNIMGIFHGKTMYNLEQNLGYEWKIHRDNLI